MIYKSELFVDGHENLMGGFVNLNQSWSKDGYRPLVKGWDGNDLSLKPEKKLKGDLNDPVVQERMVEAFSRKNSLTDQFRLCTSFSVE